MNRARVGALAAFGAIIGVGVYGLMGGTTPIGTSSELAAWPQGRADAPFCVSNLGRSIFCVWNDGGSANVYLDGGAASPAPATELAAYPTGKADAPFCVGASQGTDGGCLLYVGPDGGFYAAIPSTGSSFTTTKYSHDFSSLGSQAANSCTNNSFAQVGVVHDSACSPSIGGNFTQSTAIVYTCFTNDGSVVLKTCNITTTSASIDATTWDFYVTH